MSPCVLTPVRAHAGGQLPEHQEPAGPDVPDGGQHDQGCALLLCARACRGARARSDGGGARARGACPDAYRARYAPPPPHVGPWRCGARSGTARRGTRAQPKRIARPRVAAAEKRQHALTLMCPSSPLCPCRAVQARRLRRSARRSTSRTTSLRCAHTAPCLLCLAHLARAFFARLFALHNAAADASSRPRCLRPRRRRRRRFVARTSGRSSKARACRLRETRRRRPHVWAPSRRTRARACVSDLRAPACLPHTGATHCADTRVRVRAAGEAQTQQRRRRRGWWSRPRPDLFLRRSRSLFALLPLLHRTQ
jgi:hypothetical protein